MLECINILSNRPVYESITRNDGFWHPDSSERASSLKQFLIDEFKKLVVENSANRKQRRELTRRYFPNGRLSKEGIRLLQIRRSELLATLSEQFPFSENFFRDDLMLKFASGTASATEIVEEMSVVFRDVEKFIGWTYDTRDRERKLVSWLRDYGSDLVSIIRTLRAELDEAIRPFLAASDVKKRLSDVLEMKIREVRLSRLSETQSEVKRLDPSFKSSDADWANIRISPLGSIPSLDAHLFSFFEYFRRNLQMMRKPRPSDAGDLFHLVYLPYCDLFRADGDAAEVAKTIAPPFDTVVVPKLLELPIQIDDALKRLAA